METPLGGTSCLAPGFDIKLSDDDTECNHFTPFSKHTDCVSFSFAMQEREREREQYVSVSRGPAAGAASKGLNQVSIDTMAKPSRTTALKSSEFHTYGERRPLCVDTSRQTTTAAATEDATSAFGGLLASARCLITFKFPFGKKNCEEPRESCAVTSPSIFSHQQRARFLPTTAQSPVRDEL